MLGAKSKIRKGEETYFLIIKNVSVKQISFIALIFYIVGSLGYSYFPLVENTVLGDIYEFYNSIMITTRNGIFSGFPFVVIGAFIAYKGTVGSAVNNFWLTILFGGLFIIEALLIKYKLHTNVDMGILLLPTIYFMINWLVNIELKPNPIYLRFRNLSMLIFLGQRLFITAIPSVLPPSYMVIVTKNGYIGLMIFVLQIIIFALLIELYSKKYKWLKILW